jgi:hypothetical protein
MIELSIKRGWIAGSGVNFALFLRKFGQKLNQCSPIAV